MNLRHRLPVDTKFSSHPFVGSLLGASRGTPEAIRTIELEVGAQLSLRQATGRCHSPDLLSNAAPPRPLPEQPQRTKKAEEFAAVPFIYGGLVAYVRLALTAQVRDQAVEGPPKQVDCPGSSVCGSKPRCPVPSLDPLPHSPPEFGEMTLFLCRGRFRPHRSGLTESEQPQLLDRLGDGVVSLPLVSQRPRQVAELFKVTRRGLSVRVEKSESLLFSIDRKSTRLNSSH